MSLELLAAGVAGVAALSGVGWMLRSVVIGRSRPQESDGWPEVNPDRYAALTRLLADEDYRYLTSTPGCSPELIRAFRRGRRSVALEYLRDAAQDFERLHRAASEMLLLADSDQPELASTLARERVSFQWNLLVLRALILSNATALAAERVGTIRAALTSARCHFDSLTDATLSRPLTGC